MLEILNLDPTKLLSVLVIVHPGSACRSADWNLQANAKAERQALTNDIVQWQGGIIVIDSEDSEDLTKRSYRSLGTAIDAALLRAKAIGRTAVRRMGSDPEQMRVIRQIIKNLGLTPQTVQFDLTGAWSDGCVASVHETLKALGFEATVRDSALKI